MKSKARCLSVKITAFYLDSHNRLEERKEHRQTRPQQHAEADNTNTCTAGGRQALPLPSIKKNNFANPTPETIHSEAPRKSPALAWAAVSLPE